jgi:hypothetical protein
MTTQKNKFKPTLNYCIKDYKARHYWEMIGIYKDEYILYKCSQCGFSKLIKLKFLTPCIEE